jgi:hypothetical protein
MERLRAGMALRDLSACRWAAFTGTTILMTPSSWGRLEASKRTTESFGKY